MVYTSRTCTILIWISFCIIIYQDVENSKERNFVSDILTFIFDMDRVKEEYIDIYLYYIYCNDCEG